MRVIATEAQEQQALMEWAKRQEGKNPELALLYHTPNGGSRVRAEAARLKAQGVKPGVPDLCLPVARGGYHGMYIELKRINGGRLSKDQAMWLEELARQGYYASVCKGWVDAAKAIIRYLEGHNGTE